MKVDAKRLEEIEARERAAKAGPWFAHPTDLESREGEPPRCDGISAEKHPPIVDYIVQTDSGVYPPDLPTATFIAHARADVPDLIADLRDARHDVEVLRRNCHGEKERRETFEGEARAASREIARLKGLIDRDRTGLAAGLTAILKVLKGYRWLAAGEWGSYEEREHTQETLRKEIGWAFDALDELAARHLEQSGLRADAAFRGGPGPAESVDLGSLVLLGAGHTAAVNAAAEEFVGQLAKLGLDYRRELAARAKGKTP